MNFDARRLDAPVIEHAGVRSDSLSGPASSQRLCGSATVALVDMHRLDWQLADRYWVRCRICDRGAIGRR